MTLMWLVKIVVQMAKEAVNASYEMLLGGLATGKRSFYASFATVRR